MSSVIYDKFGADSSASFDIFSAATSQVYCDLPVAVIRAGWNSQALLDGANIAAARLLGYELPRRLIRTTPQHLFVNPQDYEQIVSSLVHAKDATACRECQLRHRNGSIIWAQVHAQAVTDPKNEPGSINLVLVDISDRKALESALEESDARFRKMLTNAAEGILMADLNTHQLFCGNPRICEMLGYSSEEIEKLTVSDIHPPEAMPRVRECFAKHSSGQLNRARDIPVLRKNKTCLYVDINSFLLTLDGKEMVVGFFHDVTDRKHAEGEAKEYQERLRSLALESSLAEERERRRLAGHLHDEVGQLLSLAQIRLSLIEPTVMHPECRKGAREMHTLLDRALQATRSLTFQLSHPAVYDLGFVAGAEWVAEDVKDLFGIVVQLFDDREPKPLDLRSRVLLLQCIRELLVNVAKHSGMKTASVRMSANDSSVHVVVEDQGSGFEPRDLRGTTEKGGFGLFSIRERLRSLGGTVNIRSSPGLGTCATLDVPIRCLKG